MLSEPKKVIEFERGNENRAKKKREQAKKKMERKKDEIARA